MPPIPTADEVKRKVEDFIKANVVSIFSKTYCPYCTKVKDLFKELGVPYGVIELDIEHDGPSIQETLVEMTKQKTVPNVFINGEHIGGCDAVTKLHSDNLLMPKLRPLNPSDEIGKVVPHNYEFDLVVIGGGSGGLAASKEAARMGAKVVVCDFVVPTPLGTSWGLGGTCVNVGCIPKKLMHQASLLRHAITEAQAFGWNLPDKITHKWEGMVEEIQSHIGSLNWGYRTSLKDQNVIYKNAYASFKDDHTLELRDKSGKVSELTSDKFVICTGERPRYLDIDGDKEHCITSDDLFSLPYCPGKTLVIGASYVALECAGFLVGLGLDVTVMVRSILLRGFDQQMAEMVGRYMEQHGTKFIKECVPVKIEKLQDGQPGLYRVTGRTQSGTDVVDTYNTILVAVGRDPCTNKIGLEKINVALDKAGRVIVDAHDRTNVPHVYAIGDIGSGRPQLTPVAIQAGKLLADRLFGGSNELTEYNCVATTVFTPLEYGAIGFSEEDAILKYGSDIDVYHSYFKPLEWTVPHLEDNACYAKLICNKADNNRVIGFHVLGPNAGEITQGYAVAMKLRATKHDFDRTIGIHPTCSEVFTTLTVTKGSGVSAAASGC
jgi:thioredoxin reductase (NADPH)